MKHASRVVIAAMVLAIGVFASVAIAGNTEVTIKSHDSQSFLDGKVKSSKPGCKTGRIVRLYGDERGSPVDFIKVAQTESDADGKWRIASPGPNVPPGHYYAKVTKDGNCDKAKSRTINVPVP